MIKVQQRVKFTTTLSKEVKEVIEEIRQEHGFSSSNMAIEYLVMNYKADKRVDKLIGLYEGTHTYIKSIAEAIEKKATQVRQEQKAQPAEINTYSGSTVEEYQTQDGWCEGHFEKGVNYKLKWVKRTTPDGLFSEEKWLCPKCINKAKENDNRIEPAL